MTIKSVEELFRKRHAELKDQPEFWKKCVEKVKRIEEDYRKSDISVDIQVEKLCVELCINQFQARTSPPPRATPGVLHLFSARVPGICTI